MNEYIIQKNLQFKEKKRPELILGINKTIRFQLVDEFGAPITLNPADVFTVAVDSNFIHTDTLMVYSDDVSVVDADNGIIEAVIHCNSISFKNKLGENERLNVWMEIRRIEAGSSHEEIILRDKCYALNSVQFDESAPSPSDPSYYTAAQIDSMLAYYRAITLAACSGLGEYLSDNSFTMTWVDPDDVTLNGATLADWNQTVLVRKIGSYPADPADGTILATTSRELGNKNAYRSTGYTDSDRETGTTYYYKLFSQTTAGVWNNLTGNQFVENTDMSWGMVQAFVRAGRGPDLFPVGTVFEVDHPEYTVNGRGIYFRVSGHDQVPAADESLTHTMCLEMVDSLFNAPYDAAESIYALTEDTTAKAGKSYYSYSGGSYTKLVEGTDYDVGDTVPAASWYEKNIDSRNHGSNNAAQSNMIQWAILQEKNGFMKHLDPLFAAAVQPAELITVRCNAEGGGSIIHNAKFWPLSITQVFGLNNNNVAENMYLKFYSDGGSTVKRNMTSQNEIRWWLRSGRSDLPQATQAVSDSGSSNATDAYTIAVEYSLACIIA